jgi:hypothetical protein
VQGKERQMKPKFEQLRAHVEKMRQAKSAIAEQDSSESLVGIYHDSIDSLLESINKKETHENK